MMSLTLRAADMRWGDQGDGTFANPVLNADYSDPDVIRVGDAYYMTCSEFHFMGMPILKSEDMVNWRVVGQVFDSINLPGYSSMEKYGNGTWAPALRYHDGKFWIFVCTPNEGLFMTTAQNAEGPWEPLVRVANVSGWEDPCPLWDDDGNAYLGRSQLGAGPIILHKMAANGKRLLDDGVKIYEGPVAEGTKLFKKDGWYYLSIPEGGVGTGWQTVLRSKDIYGPYEGKRVLETGSTDVNGPHQGALVDTPDGEWWFYHFQSAGTLGRVMHLQPVRWEDGFPVIGEDYDGNGIGEPVKICRKPAAGAGSPVCLPQTSDQFHAGKWGVQWQFNHNPDYNFINRTPRDGWLGLTPLYADRMRNSRNQFTQKLMGYKGQATVKLDYGDLKVGERAGLECIGNKYVGLEVELYESGKYVIQIEKDGSISNTRILSGDQSTEVWLRLDQDAVDNVFQFSYSLDGKNFTTLGSGFDMGDGDWKGARVGLFCYAKSEGTDEPGCAYFDDFEYLCDGPGALGLELTQQEAEVPASVNVGLDEKSPVTLVIDGSNVAVNADFDSPVKVYSPSGESVAAGLTNRMLPLPGDGLYIVYVPEKSFAFKILAK